VCVCVFCAPLFLAVRPERSRRRRLRFRRVRFGPLRFFVAPEKFQHRDIHICSRKMSLWSCRGWSSGQRRWSGIFLDFPKKSPPRQKCAPPPRAVPFYDLTDSLPKSCPRLWKCLSRVERVERVTVNVLWTKWTNNTRGKIFAILR
jgi:hypothetical protein